MPFAKPLALIVLAGTAGAARAQVDPSFAPCAACHSTKAGENRLGPSLAGVVGRKKASVTGFNYSPAMKAQQGAWTAASLDAFLTAPTKAVPGTRMIFPGVPDAKKRAALVGYLKTLK